ncbi:MAG: glycoside hydrolase family 27 protein [Sedimentisphaerales bacterium]
MKRITLLLVLCLSVCASAEKFKGLAPTPPMGWNSWNTFAMKVDEKLIKETAEALIASGMRDAGYKYVVIDDGWEAMERDAGGNLVPDPNKFPSGMKALGDYLHSKGFKFGIHNCAGTKTCSGFPGGRGHEFQDARLYASWGVDYLKYDWCYHGTANAEETYRTMGNALYATGRPIVFSLCEWGSNKPWEWGQDIGHLWRTTGDITNCYDCQETYSLGWKYILKSQIGLEKYAGPDHWNDPDMLEVGNKGLSIAESRAHFSLWCVIAAPLMAGNDVRNMSNDICDILTNKEVIAIDQDPLGKQGYQFMDHPGKQIWVKELSDGCWAVCFFNNSEEAVKLRINWANFSFLAGNYEIRDLWKKKNVGITAKNFEDKVDALDVILVKLTPVKK